MAKFRKEKFKTYLRSLPDAPFCEACNCPIAQYFSDVHSRDVAVGKKTMNKEDLPKWAQYFVLVLDGKLFKDLYGEFYWTNVTPSQCIEILEE